MNVNKKTLILATLALVILVISIVVKSCDDSLGIKIENQKVVLGVDVSRYQGDVDFKKLYSQGVRFVFIKATEGETYTDPNYEINWTNAHDTKMRVGAYHFFRFEIDGKNQAKNYIQTVENLKKSFPPVLDVEYYGDYINRPMGKKDVVKKLNDMIGVLKEHYGKYPIIYCNRFVYDAYIRGNFPECDIWYRSIETDFPALSDGREWRFWQFDDKGILEGYEGGEKYIDLNYFNGDLNELNKYSN